MDRYGWLDLRRQHGLELVEVAVLLALVARADFRSHTWSGTITEMGADLGLGRRKVVGAVDRLVAAGLLTKPRPFTQHGTGTVEVTCWAQLILEEPRGAARLDGTEPRANRAPIAPLSRDPARFTREKDPSMGSEGEGEEKLLVVPWEERPFGVEECFGCGGLTALTAADGTPRCDECPDDLGMVAP